MTLRCRLGIHDWAHFGYHFYYDVSYQPPGSEGVPRHRAFQKCTACGKRRTGDSKLGKPPEIRENPDGTYTDYSRPLIKEN